MAETPKATLTYEITGDNGKTYAVPIDGTQSPAAQKLAVDEVRKMVPGIRIKSINIQDATPEFGYFDARDQFAKGLTFDTSDELAGGVEAAMGGDYGNAVKQYRENDKRAQENHPWKSLGANVAGSLVGSLVAPWLGARRGIGYLDTIKKGMQGGAITGALTGAGATPGGPMERAGGAVAGGVGGAVLGGGAPAVTGAAGGATQRVANAAEGNLAGRLLQKIPGISTKEEYLAKQGGYKILEAFERGKISLDDAEKKIAQLGPASMLADVSNSLRQLADTAALFPSNEVDDALLRLETRGSGARGRTAQAASNALRGAEGHGKDQIDDLTRIQKTEAGPAYSALWQRYPGAVKDPSITEYLDMPHFRQAYESAQQSNILRKKPDPPEGPTFQTLNNVKMRIGNMLHDRTLDPDTRSALQDAQTEFVKALDAKFKEYAVVRKRYSDPADLKDAIGSGMKYFQMTPEQITRSLQEFSPDQREAFREGVMTHLNKKIYGNQGSPSMWYRVASEPQENLRLRRAFGSKEAYARFQKDMEAERQFRLSQDVVKGSQTAGRAVRVADFSEDSTANLIPELVNPNPVGLMQKFANMSMKRDLEPIAGDVVRQLTGDPKRALDPLRKLREEIDIKKRSPFRMANPAGYVGGGILFK